MLISDTFFAHKDDTVSARCKTLQTGNLPEKHLVIKVFFRCIPDLFNGLLLDYRGTGVHSNLSYCLFELSLEGNYAAG